MINGNGDEYTPGKCYECRAGEHEDYSDDIEMCKITQHDGKSKHMNLCGYHRESNDFASVRVIPRAR
jgi:hypothetical protein